MKTSPTHFDHEKLVAYQRSIEFVAWSSQLLETLPAKWSVTDQLDRASTSIPLNIAEGNSKHSAPDRCRYLDAARGSAFECAACLDVLVAKKKCSLDQIETGKKILRETVSVRSIAPDRLSEEPVDYETEAKA